MRMKNLFRLKSEFHVDKMMFKVEGQENNIKEFEKGVESFASWLSYCYYIDVNYKDIKPQRLILKNQSK